MGTRAVYQKREGDGAMTRQEAQDAAKVAVKALRYDKVEYFWINDMQPKMIMHPTKPELDGTDLSANADASGKLLFVEFVQEVRTQGAGFVSYLWPKPNHKDPVRKLSYVSGFEPWGWVIGSGIYLDDVDVIVARKGNDVLQSAAATDQIAAEVEAIQATSNEAATVMARMA